MKVLIDTNVILDVLCDRDGYAEASATIWKYCETGIIEGYISALSVPNIIYILRKELTFDKTQAVINQLSVIFKIADLKSDDLIKASGLKFSDYEDAVQFVCAARVKAMYIVTRNQKDYAGSDIKAVSPSEFIEIIRKEDLLI